MHVSDMCSWTWTCRRSTLDWQSMPSTIGASRVLACFFSRWHVSAFQRKGVAARSQGSQWTQPVNAASKRTISSDITCTLKTSICLAHLFPSLTRSSSPFALCVLSHTSSCSLPARQLPFFATVSFISTCLSHTHTPALLSPFVSVAFFIASVAFPGCPLLHPLSSPRPSVACLFNLIWYLDCASVHSANTTGQSARPGTQRLTQSLTHT